MRVRVETGSRLHLGFLDLEGGLGRRYGSIGVALDRPGAVLEAEEWNGWSYEGEEVFREKTEEAVRAVFSNVFGEPDRRLPPIRICLSEAIPAHVGLGSGTQIALAAGVAASKLLGLPGDPRKLAVMLKRGRRSGIGVEAFAGGGFLVDGGVGERPSDAPPLLFRKKLPEAWRFLVLLPAARPGISGAEEERAMSTLPPVPRTLAGDLCRMVLLLLLPALAEGDGPTFGRALTEIQRLVGECFAPAQGGVYSSALSERLVTGLLEEGALGAGQSSWGPAIFGFFDDPAEAQRVRKRMLRVPELAGGTVVMARAAAGGARVLCDGGAGKEGSQCAFRV